MDKFMKVVEVLNDLYESTPDVIYVGIEPLGIFVQLKNEAFFKRFKNYDETNGRFQVEEEGILFYTVSRKATAGTVA